MSWRETTYLDGQPGTAIVIILPTKGCKWALGDQGGCFMCGYIEDAPIDPSTQEELWNEFERALNIYKDVKDPFALRIFNSGSFFDEEEVSIALRERIFHKIEKDPRIKEVTIETRPEYVLKQKLLEMKQCLPSKRIEIAIGLESSNDQIRVELINKGFDFKSFKKAINIIKSNGIASKAYLLLKPPFLSEEEAIQDVLLSIKACKQLGIEKISINPCTVQKGTLVEKLWKERRYRPPWLWSVLQILTILFSSNESNPVIICEPTAGGKVRGAHNCGKCDNDVLKAINRISLTQTLKEVIIPECECKSIWITIKKQELIAQRSILNLLSPKVAELYGTDF
ncbi:MAG: archaeosine biosynthesis radical SAM protein RaSEA [Promethearchaeota archaeon]